jgi:hypothetical protein
MITMAELPVLPLFHDDVDERDGDGATEEQAGHQGKQNIHF